MNSYGRNSNPAGGDGIQGTVVSYSYGNSGGTAASADGIEAIGCYAIGGEDIDNKYLMP